MPTFTIKNRNILFIHIPKTGGSSIWKWIDQEVKNIKFYSNQRTESMKVTPQHLTKRDVAAYLGDSFDYQFAVVRNPYERMESEFFYRMGLHRKRIDKNCLAGFSHWVLRQIDEMRRDKCHCDNHFRRQVEFVDSEVEVFNFESGLEQIATVVNEKTGLNSHDRISQHKKSQREPVAWSRRALYKFNQYYEQDFSAFGYTIRETPSAVTDSYLDSKFQLKLNTLKALIRTASK